MLKLIYYAFGLIFFSIAMLANSNPFQYASIIAELHHKSCNQGLYHLQKARNTHTEKKLEIEIEVITRTEGKVIVYREIYKVNSSDTPVLGCTAERLESGKVIIFQRTILKVSFVED